MRKVWQIVMNWVSLIYFKECRAYFAASAPDMLHVFTPDTGAALMIRAGHELNIPCFITNWARPITYRRWIFTTGDWRKCCHFVRRLLRYRRYSPHSGNANSLSGFAVGAAANRRSFHRAFDIIPRPATEGLSSAMRRGWKKAKGR
jgi:hypothetical protein